MELTSRAWEEFFIENVFKIKSGKRLTKADMISGEIPFVGATDSNNGITEFIANKNSSLDKNVLGVNYNGSVVYNFYHSYEAVFSDDVKRLSFKEIEGNKYSFLFVKALILQQKSKYEYGYKFNGERMKRQKILLPVTSKGNPDYAFMECYMKQKEKELLAQYKKHTISKISEIKEQLNAVVEWKEFVIGDIFKIYSTSSSIDKNRLTGKKGLFPYITRTDKNNGYDLFIGEQPKYLTDKGNVITIGLDTQTVFYQKARFYTGQNIQILEFDELNEHNAQFIIALLKIQMTKFNWGGNGATLTRLKKTKILLPKNDQDNPDFRYMENYMKALRTDKLKQYLEYKLLKLTD
ncbi:MULTISPECIES: restriction endonuclease subunit S [Acinetobacter]|uniref:restriction endonuclease subunit S n=1 Tax=Acinetobacter TaxID=469 RepID=UPI002487AD45|nr:restriction endonuclease subunit S [Acinetobacter sp.]MDI1225327.1 restriction endonuclease subunit S [Acinetobacter sp.]